jgi:hypothetical protein
MTPDAERDPHILGPDRAPTPFTAAEIRAGCPEGLTIRMLVEPDGADPFIRVSRFVGCDAEGAILERTRTTLDGEVLGPTEPARSTWLELQQHASFPADRTTIEPETLTTPMGPLDCLRYRIVDGSSVENFWFARSLPGMPVRYSVSENGRQTSVTTMIGSEVRAPGS